ncbi:MAG: hypothetical protein JWO88_3568, partial [Frankiales bacterium]|nr:hypothetical protein [Frankiales bacterium]
VLRVITHNVMIVIRVHLFYRALGSCFDLLDPENVKALDRYHKAYLKDLKDLGEKPRANYKSDKYLNCAVFQLAYAIQDGEEPEQRIETCRAVFIPTDSKNEDKRLWKGAGINRDAHIQICVREPRCILGTWLVKPMEG